jgi:hypothetical protein
VSASHSVRRGNSFGLRRGINEVVILRDQLFERIAASVHNAFNRVIASRADKRLSLVTKMVIGMRTASR